jgi:hypothetical protein
VSSDTWVVLPGSQVRLTSARIGLMSMDAVAPIASGSLSCTDETVTLDLEISLDQLKANLLLQSAARALVKQHSATRLTFHAEGPSDTHPWRVTGTAVAGDVEIPLTLSLSRSGDTAQATGSANLGTVDLPLPGVGRLEDFSFSVDAQVAIARA